MSINDKMIKLDVHLMKTGRNKIIEEKLDDGCKLVGKMVE